MRSLLAICIFIFFAPVTLKAQEKNMLLTGKVRNSQPGPIFLGNHYYSFETLVNEQGNFSFDEYVQHPDFLNLNFGEHQLTLLLVGGDTAHISFDLENFKDSINYSGEKFSLNQELVTVSQGEKAPGFSMQDVNGNEISLSDFKGKYVYIDVWNSRCGPCFKEFPHMEELIDKYRHQDLVFLGVSFDKDKKSWLKTINRKKLGGIQLFAEGWNSDFAKTYHVHYNPRFILIDKSQNILYLSAPRPSGNIEDVLNTLKL